jgi:DNA-directed RNA polymerase subunit L
MKKEGKDSLIGDEISAINHLMRVLEKHIGKLEIAYRKKDHTNFNILKKEIIQLQKKIHSIIK